MINSNDDQRNEPKTAATRSNAIEIPRITLPKGGGALRSIDEKFQINAVNGTASFNIPLPITPGRNGFTPALSLSYNSGSGNGLFGLGWDVSLTVVQLKADKRLPRYGNGGEAEDVYTLSGEDLVPFLDKMSDWSPVEKNVGKYFVKQYRPRIETGFSRIEKIDVRGSTALYWKVTTKDNVVTFFGVSDSHRIADPADPSRIFKWLPEFSFDDKGNLMRFDFKPEDLANVKNELHERNRFNKLSGFSNKHIKAVRYGNRTPYFPGYASNPANIDEIFNPSLPEDHQYFFELVFDYGEHGANLVTETDENGQVKHWNARTDPFSEYRPGFEMRTYRLCERVLMFHHFDELVPDYGEKTCLVRSLDLKYQDKGTSNDQPLEVTYLKSITQKGYARNKAEEKYKISAFPSIAFDYNELKWSAEIKTISPENIVNAPVGLSADYQWIDLYNEGISGILTDQADGWYYKSNLGGGEFSMARAVTQKPSFSTISTRTVQLQDIEANGKRQAVLLTGDAKGYFELSDDEAWQPFRMFDQVPTRDLRDDYTRFIDLNGDGMPELVVSEDHAFAWYPARGIQGYGEAEYTIKPFDEERGPAIVFADSTESIFLADMSGDGLTDIVRIRNGDTCYWPNLGYGKFGARIQMTNSPVFDSPDQFNPAYLHLADVSGTGATDMLYLGKNSFKAWLNLSGNAWTIPCEIDPFPETSIPNQLAVVDLLGNGTSSIVWSSPLPANSGAPMQYIDLMGGAKPHIMVRHQNTMGKETMVEYQSSTHFYLADKKAGKPWATKLPFPVHCVSRIEVIDTVTALRFTTKYAYHHGYYDHEEREFRGFGMVEQIDTEEYAYLKNVNAANAAAPEFHEPPILTKTWFHTGAYLRHRKLTDHFRAEYWHQDPSVLDTLAVFGMEADSVEWQLPETEFVGSFSTSEFIEAHRACKGMMLREEIFSLDRSEKEKLPYSVSARNCHIKLLQPGKRNKHAVFLALESQAISYSYERTIRDARIVHNLNLEVDDFGNVLKSVSVVYPRAEDAIVSTVNGLDVSLHGHLGTFRKSQGKGHIIYTESRVTSDAKEAINGSDLIYYRLPVSWSVKTYEAGGIVKSGNFYRLSDFDPMIAEGSLTFIGYHEKLPLENGVVHLRLIEETQTLFLAYDLTKALNAGMHGASGITYESYQLAYTPALVNFLYNTDTAGNSVDPKRVTDAELVKGKFCHLSGLDQNWWIRSGTIQYIDPLLAETRANAAQRFYMPLSYTDPFGSVTRVSYYKDYWLLMQETTDALDNVTRIEAFDFRTLSPRKVKDNNDNMVEVAMDALGFLAGTAVMGKGNEGDNLLDFVADLSAEQVQDFFADPFVKGRGLLKHATMRLVYDLTKVPCAVGTILREEHHA
ncbi:MAG: SpvB/TcaC N-terminal domain-containing protein, partial [Chryseosolibacter sp.]